MIHLRSPGCEPSDFTCNLRKKNIGETETKSSREMVLKISWLFINLFIDWLIDWLVFDANFSNISTISWREQILL